MHTSRCLKTRAAVDTVLLPAPDADFAAGSYLPGLTTESPPTITNTKPIRVAERFGLVVANEARAHLLVFRTNPVDQPVEDMRIPLAPGVRRYLVPFDGWAVVEPKAQGEVCAWLDDLAALDAVQDKT